MGKRTDGRLRGRSAGEQPRPRRNEHGQQDGRRDGEHDQDHVSRRSEGGCGVPRVGTGAVTAFDDSLRHDAGDKQQRFRRDQEAGCQENS
jgi:hypothetical protein